MNNESPTIKDWIKNPSDYKNYCDPELMLLKMEIYTGNIPEWLKEKDIQQFKSGIRKKVIREGENEGLTGFSGRESINVFNEFFSMYVKNKKIITMDMVYRFFSQEQYKKIISKEFLSSLVNSYDYTILQQVKHSLYSYNKKQIAANIQNYIFAVNFEVGAVEKCKYTGQIIEITESFFKNIEDILLGTNLTVKYRSEFRKEILKKYVSIAATEMKIHKKRITSTELYKELHDKYVRKLKNNALDPFLENANFRNAIREYNTKEFISHDKKIKKDVTFLMKNLIKKYKYTESGAKEVCIYLIDKGLAKKF